MKFRPEADIWPVMSDDELKALAADIDKVGQLQPISLYRGDILDGRNRWLAITRFSANGRTPQTVEVAPESPIAFTISSNEKRRHLNDSQRQMAAARSLPFFEAEAKQRTRGPAREKGAPIGAPKHRASDDAALAFGTSPRGVERAKSVQAKGSKKLVEAVERGELSLAKAEQITKLYPDKKAQDAQVTTVRKSRMVTRVKGLTGEVEWYTPRPYLDAAIAVMGAIDLDPASSDAAQSHVKAGRYYTLTENGLEQSWAGRVFLNPPYAMPYVKNFVAKIVGAYTASEISEGILLTNNATDTEWFHWAAHTCAALCLTRGRIHFLEARNGELVEKTSPTHGQTFFYFGSKTQLFEEVFSEYGIVLCRANGGGR